MGLKLEGKMESLNIKVFGFLDYLFWFIRLMIFFFYFKRELDICYVDKVV